MHRTSEGRSRQRRPALLCILPGRSLFGDHAVRRDGQAMRSHPAAVVHGTACQHGARLHGDARACALSRHAADSQHGARRSRQATAGMGCHQAHACGRDAPRRHGQRPALVRHKRVPCLPRDECLGRRRNHRGLRDAVGDGARPARRRGPPWRPRRHGRAVVPLDFRRGRRGHGVPARTARRPGGGVSPHRRPLHRPAQPVWLLHVPRDAARAG